MRIRITLVAFFLVQALRVDAAVRPNIVVILTDDQGFGDLSCHGNPHLQTPNLDKLAAESARFSHFYVAPVCSPTRASLLTGRYNYRTGVVDTYLGRSMMYSDEVTLAEMLREHGYRTGIFGKWHLGDNYPMRPIDQGFEEALVHKGGGIGQPSDPPGGDSYFDPVLQHNGKEEKAEGYCSDVFATAAIRFIKENRSRPTFVWLAFNAPHAPLQVPDKYYALFRGKNLEWEQSGGRAGPAKAGTPNKANQDNIARVYGMVRNIDDNVGRVLSALDELRLATNTIVVFLTDNGPQQARYNSGMRGLKGSVYEGGIRVPLFIRWPGKLPARVLPEPAAHIDFTPTVLESCGLSVPTTIKFEGRSLWPLLLGTGAPPAKAETPLSWTERSLFFQWHRGDTPEPRRAFAVRGARYKLVQAKGAARAEPPKYELFDLSKDPGERDDLSAELPEVRDRLLREYDAWFKDVTAIRGYRAPRIYVGDVHENPTVLTRQDWRGPKAGWSDDSIGHWELDVRRAGTYEITLAYRKLSSPAILRLKLGGVEVRSEVTGSSHRLAEVKFPSGEGDLHCSVEEDGKVFGVDWMRVRLRASGQ